MALATLLNIPGEERGMLDFSFANQDEHFKIAERVRAIFDVSLLVQPLDPLRIDDLSGWLYRHQQMHNQQNAVLGIRGNDLTGLDPQDKAQLAGWIWLHFSEHQQAANVLRLT